MKLFAVLAGISEDHFTIGDVDFYAAPVTLQEYAEFQTLEPGNDVAWRTYMADRLSRRIKNKTKTKEADITPEWLLTNLPAAFQATLQYVLLNGEMPKEEAGEKKAGG